MDFKPARPDAIRAINQRWLLKFWMRHLTGARVVGARVPRWQAIKVDDLASISDHLSLLEVTGGPKPRFQIRFHGRLIAPVYGAADCRGRYLDEFIRAERHDRTLAPYRHTAQTGAPVYTSTTSSTPGSG